MSSHLAFICPLSPSASVRPPKGDGWLHEPKWDGFRFQVIKDGARVRFYSRHGADYTDRLPRMVEAFGKLPTQSTILDGELVLIDPRAAAHFYRLMAQMRTSHPDESRLVFLVFDLLHQDGVETSVVCRYPSVSAIYIGFASSRGYHSCARSRLFPTVNCSTNTATSLASKGSYPSGCRLAT